MAWADAKARIVAVLETLAITTPDAQTIKKVYPNPPGTIGDVPCVIVYPPARGVDRANSIRAKHYTVRLRLLLRDADLSQASALVDAYGEAIIDLFDGELTLSTTATAIEGPVVEEAADFEYPLGSGKHYTGFDVLLTVHIEEGKAFSG